MKQPHHTQVGCQVLDRNTDALRKVAADKGYTQAASNQITRRRYQAADTAERPRLRQMGEKFTHQGSGYYQFSKR